MNNRLISSADGGNQDVLTMPLPEQPPFSRTIQRHGGLFCSGSSHPRDRTPCGATFLQYTLNSRYVPK